ncbi:unnamed protein product [Aspergillus oryzae RIB40]|uniref:DNA, SC001 n=2 Tax=Aspergillus oryzae TaxID=5062 RepID=Q2UP10_ASPOR|nr:unnamed protein product [Aspergillus oryzae RIB40]EIT77621.1 hypothetical protein Ao3042_06168 [Aspergillus oryzae 3.042]KDE83079.1 hypothetical protein AO1008_09556 [Aspergillus oryzae 100-8]BAE56705.1 unnamed protein product [Aspergillus oryzae RIB40]|eukprot:EIT77621.1 hypothetical protein Ao3042_06168 [Aspergillus oryzae 3.042]
MRFLLEGPKDRLDSTLCWSLRERVFLGFTTMMADGNENRLEQESRGFQTSWMTPSVPDREITGEPVAQTLAKLVVTRDGNDEILVSLFGPLNRDDDGKPTDVSNPLPMVLILSFTFL